MVNQLAASKLTSVILSLVNGGSEDIFMGLNMRRNFNLRQPQFQTDKNFNKHSRALAIALQVHVMSGSYSVFG